MIKDLLPKFLEYSHSRKPWEFHPENFFELFQFVKKFSMDEMDSDVIMRNYFENYIIEGETVEEDYAYVLDLIGTDKESYEKVLLGRTDYYLRIFELAAAGKSNKIFLSPEPDAYCKSCAIGKHCTTIIPDAIDNDLRYKEAFEKFLDTQEGVFCDSNGMIGIDKKGNIFVTAELFFNESFSPALESLVNAIK